MAIHPPIPGLEISISIQGTTAQEYPTTTDTPPDSPSSSSPSDEEADHIQQHQQERTTTNYIECTTGSPFSTTLSLRKPFRFRAQGLTFESFVDGQVIANQLALRSEFRKRNAYDYEIRGVEEGNQVRGMRFAEIRTSLKETKKKDLAKQATELDSVGIICVYVNRVRGKKQRKSTKEGKSTEVTTRNADDVVHEKLLVKDSKSHSVALGSKTDVDLGETWETEYVDGEEYPLAIFVFKYRSHKALQDLLIIPRTPSPSPPPDLFVPAISASNSIPSVLPSPLINLEALSEEEQRNFTFLFQKAVTSNPNRLVKRERDENENGSEVGVKVEGDSKPPRAPKRLYKEKVTIDLTEEWEEGIVVN